MTVKKLTIGLIFSALTAVLAADETPAPAGAPQTPDQAAAEYANATHIAYIATGDQSADDLSRQGLNALAQALVKKVNFEFVGVAAVNIEKDDIAFFPFIYWPVNQAKPLSPAAQEKIQSYIDNGGLILLEMPSQADMTALLDTTTGAPDLRKILGDKITVRPLIRTDRMKETDPLLTVTHAFYNTVNTSSRQPGLPGPGMYDNPVWLGTQAIPGRESALSLIVGDNKWISAWASALAPMSAEERETALRSGINMVLEAVTGNYKADYVHRKLLQQRLTPQ